MFWLISVLKKLSQDVTVLSPILLKKYATNCLKPSHNGSKVETVTDLQMKALVRNFYAYLKPSDNL